MTEIGAVVLAGRESPCDGACSLTGVLALIDSYPGRVRDAMEVTYAC
jgi:hypothetical protein